MGASAPVMGSASELDDHAELSQRAIELKRMLTVLLQKLIAES